MLTRTISFLLFVLLCSCSLNAEKSKDIQTATTELAPTASWATFAITIYYHVNQPTDKDFDFNTYVAGTGFIIDKQGDFITAAHVLDAAAELKSSNALITQAELRASIRQKSGDSSGLPFDVIDKDSDHDLALCRLKVFKVYAPRDSPIAKQALLAKKKGTPWNVDTAHPFASLAISHDAPQVGRFTLVSGYPLYSWVPTIQFGLVSATEEVYGQNPGLPNVLAMKDHRHLLQISVSANHGNSGGPVIDLYTGKVVGVILDIVPAPLQVQNRQILDSGTFAASGLMLAAPASWVNALLKRHNIVSVGVPEGHWVIW